MTEPGIDRRRYLEQRFAEALVQTRRVLDPHDATTGALLAGLGTLALLAASPIVMKGVAVVCYLLVVGVWQVHRRRRVAAALGQLHVLASRDAGAPRPVDAAHVANWPPWILELDDVYTVAAVESVLRPSPENRRRLRHVTRAINNGAVSVFVTAAMLMLLGLVGVVVTVLSSGGEPRALTLIAMCTLASLPGYLLSRTLVAYSDFGRYQQAALADRAERKLGSLGKVEGSAAPFTEGHVVVWNGDGYRLERSAMAPPPGDGRPRPLSQILPWLLGSVVAMAVVSAAVVEMLA